MNPVISAFTVDQAAKLTGLSEDQIRRWDTEELISPSLGWENRRRPLSRIYTFEDLLALRTLARLKEYRVSTQQLKKLRRFLDTLAGQPWTGRQFFVNRKTREVYFTHEDAMVAAKPMGQTAMIEIVELGPIVEDVQSRLKRLSDRIDERGQIVTDRYIHGGAPIFAGTRIPVSSVVEILNEGATDEEILLEFPRLSAEDIQVARAHQAA